MILCVTYLLRRNHFWALRSETSKRFVILWERNQVLSHLKYFKASRRGHSHSCNLPGLVWLGAYHSRSRTWYVKVERGSTLTFTRYLPYTASVLFTRVKCTCVGTRKLEKLWGGGGGEFLSPRNFFSLSNSLFEFFFRP